MRSAVQEISHAYLWFIFSHTCVPSCAGIYNMMSLQFLMRCYVAACLLRNNVHPRRKHFWQGPKVLALFTLQVTQNKKSGFFSNIFLLRNMLFFCENLKRNFFPSTGISAKVSTSKNTNAPISAHFASENFGQPFATCTDKASLESRKIFSCYDKCCVR
jgi:hypothetical protein